MSTPEVVYHMERAKEAAEALRSAITDARHAAEEETDIRSSLLMIEADIDYAIRRLANVAKWTGAMVKAVRA